MKVGLVGCGFMGRMHANVYGSLDGATLVGVVDRNPEKAQKFAEEFGAKPYESLEAMLQDVDAVDICLPTHLHAEAAVLALDSGKYVFCEKPMALTLTEADQMIAAADRSGKTLMIGHCIRFWPEYAMLKEAIDDQRFGKLLSLNLTRYGEFPFWSSENWLADESKSGGGVLDMHIHDTDFALFALGEPEETYSRGTIDGRGPGHVFTTLTYPGAVIHTEGGWNLPTKSPFKMAFRAIFEQGAMIFDGGPLTIYQPNQEPVTPEFPKMSAAGGGNISDLGGYYHELKYFVEKVTSGQPLETVTPQTSRASLALTLEEIRQIKARG